VARSGDRKRLCGVQGGRCGFRRALVRGGGTLDENPLRELAGQRRRPTQRLEALLCVRRGEIRSNYLQRDFLTTIQTRKTESGFTQITKQFLNCCQQSPLLPLDAAHLPHPHLVLHLQFVLRQGLVSGELGPQLVQNVFVLFHLLPQDCLVLLETLHDNLGLLVLLQQLTKRRLQTGQITCTGNFLFLGVPLDHHLLQEVVIIAQHLLERRLFVPIILQLLAQLPVLILELDDLLLHVGDLVVHLHCCQFLRITN
jgi:hypothetical protein